MNKDLRVGFRSPCFTVKGPTNTNVIDHLSEILVYTESYDRNEKLLPLEKDDAEDYICLSSSGGRNVTTQETQDKPAAATTTITNPNHQSIRSIPKSSNVPVEFSQDKSIKMLEPHLIGFRKILSEDGCNIDGYNVGDDGNRDKHKNNRNFDLTTKIPLSLIRVARFFPFKWMPIKKALIRPPLSSEVEVGINTRLSLARALYKKGILAGAEMNELEEACQRLQCCEKGNDRSTRKRKRDNESDMTLYDQLRITFSRMPIDLASSTTANTALRHMKIMIDDYCQLSDDMHKKEINTRNDTHIPSIDQVIDWALVSFNAVVLSNGFENLNKDSFQYQVESKMVTVLQSSCEKNGGTTAKFGTEMSKKIRELVEPETLDQATSLNHLCLVRYLSYLPIVTVEEIFLSTIVKSFESRCDLVLSVLPKIFASYVSILSHQRELQLDLFEKNLCDQLRGRNQEEKDLFDLLFRTTRYLLKNHSLDQKIKGRT